MKPTPKPSKATTEPAQIPSQEAVEAAYAIIGAHRGHRGGEARKAALSPARRKEIAKLGGLAKAAKFKGKRKVKKDTDSA